MKLHRSSVVGGLTLIAVCGALTASSAIAPQPTVAPAYAYALPNVPGKTVTAMIVTYPPGTSTPPHRHGQAFVIAYVLEGAVKSQVDDEPVRVFRVGESWTENPGAHHRVSANASATEPAKLLAILIADSGAKDLVSLDQAPTP